MSGALGGGVASFGASYTRGNSDQDNATALAADSTSRRVQGDFSKLSYSLGWLSSLPYALSLNTTLRGQIPGNNLDSSEQFSLGGTNGVRAYPTGEASGDEGWLFSVNIGKKLSGKLSTSLFFDAGSIRLNHTLWSGWNASNPDLPNTYILYGVGAGVDWRFSQAVLLSASIANPIGSNPGADTSDLNVDGSENGLRGWINISAKF
jgi:hemolysin activation/secretion protein